MQRRGVKRTHSTPYERKVTTNAPSADDPWAHDLFDPLSSLYAPVTNPKMLYGDMSQRPASKARPSPSAAPFGPTLTPALAHQQQVVPAPEIVQRVQQQPVSLLDRLRTDAPPRPQSAPVAPRVARVEARPLERPGEQRHRGSDLMDVEMGTAAPPPPSKPSKPKGTTVRVANLVDGTSAEDVKTAFSQFGAIITSRIAKTVASGTKRLLTAEIVFENATDAKTAVDTLHGALADGENLEVVIVKDPPTGPRSQNVPANNDRRDSRPSRDSRDALSRSANSQPANGSSSTSAPDLLSRMGLGPAQPQKQQQKAEQPHWAVQQPAPSARTTPLVAAIPTSGGMRSDAIAALDPRATLQTQPRFVGQVEPDSVKQNGRGRRGRGGQQRGAAAQERRQPVSTSLFDRISGSAAGSMDLS